LRVDHAQNFVLVLVVVLVVVLEVGFCVVELTPKRHSAEEHCWAEPTAISSRTRTRTIAELPAPRVPKSLSPRRPFGPKPPHLTGLRITPVKGCLKSQSRLDKSKPQTMFIRTHLPEAPPVNKSDELVLKPNYNQPLINPLHPMATKSIPEGYHSITPSFCVDGAQEFINFLKEVFAAQDRFKMDGPGGKVMHAELSIGDSAVMVSDVMPQWPAKSNSLYVYVDDVDATYRRALKAGATSVRTPENAFYGDRTSAVQDPFGNMWGIATHVEDVPPDEMQKRAEAFQKQFANAS
jgi:PhnB protein